MPKIKRKREERGFTQETLATASQISRSHLTQIENGKANPTQATLKKIAKVLNCKVSDLVED